MKEQHLSVLNYILRILPVFGLLLSAVTIPSPGTLAAAEAAPVDVRGLSAALSPRGELWAVWSADNGHDTELLYSRWAGQGWKSPQPVYTNPETWDDTPSLAFATDGTPWVAWTSANDEGRHLYVSRWVGYRWSRPEEVPTAPATWPRQPVLAATPDGGFWLAWVGFDGNDEEVYAAFWNGLTWSEPYRIGQDDTDPAAYDTQPRLAVGPDGSAWIAWTGYKRFLADAIFAARWNGRQWEPEQQVSADGEVVSTYPSLAIAADGTVWLAWHSRSSTDLQRIHVSRWTQSTAWQEEMIVSSPPESDISEERPCLLLDAAGRPQVLWDLSGGKLGMGYAAFDGARWSAPKWAMQESIAESICLVENSTPLIVWWPADMAATLPSCSWVSKDSLDMLPLFESPDRLSNNTQAVPNRHLAFGDSITWGKYDDPATGQPVGDYPARLEQLLDYHVAPSEVVNDGLPGERTSQGKWRLHGVSLPTYQPQFTEIMEGTNDITHGRPYNEIALNLSDMVKYAKKVEGHPLLATLIPRQDGLNRETKTMNDYIADVAAERKVPLVDTWQAFYNYGNWQALYTDALHPNSEGMAVLAATWYEALLANTWLDEDTTPPNTWIESLPPQSLCGQVEVSWNGSDNVSWVVSYDVQVSVNYGEWTDWLVETQSTGGLYTSGLYNAIIGFRVRGRDAAGNQSAYSASAYTQIADDGPPYNVGISPLPRAQKAPFRLRWWAEDQCSAVTAYDVEFRVGPAGTWSSWLSSTPFTWGTFDPTPPQYGQTYYFRSRARDQAGNWSGWSAAVYTTLARFTVAGNILTIRHQPIAGAEVTLTPAVLNVERRPGGYLAYLADAGTYDLIAMHDSFGLLPPLHLSVSGDLSGVDLVLPPLDDVVENGGFESGWGDWQPGGTLTPTLITAPHTGNRAALLGGQGELSWLKQPLSLPDNLTDATLSFLVRLDDDAEGSSTLQVALEGTPISHTQTISAGGWSHIWLPVEAILVHRNGIGASQVVTLTFTVSDSAALRLDEVSLGSALSGADLVYLPLVLRAYSP